MASYLGKYHSDDFRDWPEKAFWEQALGDATQKNGKLFLVLDGVDELSYNRKFSIDLLGEVQKWTRQGNVVLITCRTRSLGAYKSKLADFEILRINGLNWDETQQFVRKYSVLPSPDKLIEAFRHQPAMLQLARDPFLLDVICYLAAEDQGKLPECRSELIDKAIDRLLMEVESSQFIWPDGTQPSDSFLRQVLATASLVLRLSEAQNHMYLFSA